MASEGQRSGDRNRFTLCHALGYLFDFRDLL